MGLIGASWPFLILSLAFATGALLSRKVSPGGALVGLGIHWVIALGTAWAGWLALLWFFVGSVGVGRLFRRGHPDLEGRHEHTGPRTLAQVLANGGPQALASLVALAGQIMGESALVRAGTIAVIAGFAGAAADTWAGEVGMGFRRPPRSILGWKTLEKGRSGGVSAPGFVGALAGAFLGALLVFMADQPSLALFLGIFVLAFASSLLDSILGAGLQALYRDSRGQWTERPRSEGGESHILVRGLRWMTNDMVNLVSVAACTLLALGLLWVL